MYTRMVLRPHKAARAAQHSGLHASFLVMKQVPHSSPEHNVLKCVITSTGRPWNTSRLLLLRPAATSLARSHKITHTIILGNRGVLKHPVDEAAPQGLAWCLNGVTASTCSATLTPTLAARHGVTSRMQPLHRAATSLLEATSHESCTIRVLLPGCQVT